MHADCQDFKYLIEEAVVLSADIFNLHELVQPLIEQRNPGLMNSQINSLHGLLTSLTGKGQGEVINFSGGGFLAFFAQAPTLKQNIHNSLNTALEIMAAFKNHNFPWKLSAGIDWGELFVARGGKFSSMVLGGTAVMAQLFQSLARDNEVIIPNLTELEDREFIKGLVRHFGFKMLTQRVSLRDKKGKIIRIMEEGKEEPEDFSGFLKNFLKFEP